MASLRNTLEWIVWFATVYVTFSFGSYSVIVGYKLLSETKHYQDLIPLFNPIDSAHSKRMFELFTQLAKVTDFSTFGLGSHVLIGGIYYLLLPFQFLPQIRKRFIIVHRCVGYLFFLCAFTHPIGLYFIYPILPATVSSAALFHSIVAYVTAIMALLSIWRRDIVRHREWILRNVSVALSTVVLRMVDTAFYRCLNFMGIYPVDTVDELGVILWWFFTGSLLLMEVYIQSTRSSSNLSSSSTSSTSSSSTPSSSSLSTSSGESINQKKSQ